MATDTYITSGILELYVAGVLPADEAAEVEAMAASHPEIQNEIEKLDEVYREYARRHAPEFPSHLMDSIITKVEKMPAEPVAAEPAVKTLSTDKKKKRPEKELAAPVEEMRPRQPLRQEQHSSVRKLLAAAVVLLILSALTNLYLYDQWTSSEIAFSASEKEKMTLSDQARQAQLSAQATQEMLQMYRDTSFRRLTLRGLAAAPAARAVIFWNKRSRQVYLVPESLPHAPEGKQYQLWAANEKGPTVDAGIIPPGRQPAPNIVKMKDIDRANAFMLSLEPIGGSASPTEAAIYAMVYL